MGLDDFKEVQEKKEVDASKKLRVGIIGCGVRGFLYGDQRSES